MTDTHLALAVLVVAGAGAVLLAGSRVAEAARVPLPLLVLAAAAAVAALVPQVGHPPLREVQRAVTLALVAVLFDGGMHIGWGRLRRALVPVAVVGVAGTLLTAAGLTVLLHGVVGLAWYPAALTATALAPTDPTVVFSVLGRRRIGGSSGTILEGESGANDPVGIALMAGLLGAGGLSPSGAAHIAGTFAEQMAIGLAVGAAGGRLLLVAMRRLPLPGEGLYPLRTLAAAYLLYGAGALAHGSGFLAVFVAGIVVGDARAPFKLEIERFHGALASLAELVAFVALGLTVDLGVLGRADVWAVGLGVAALLTVVVRPLLVGPCLLAARLTRAERTFVTFAGLKGAVPILLGGAILGAGVAGADRLYGIVVVVVAVSVLVQGGLVGPVTRLLRLPVDEVAPLPWAVGVRLPEAPDEVARVAVAAGSPGDGARVADLTAAGLPDGAWITLLVRDGELRPVRGDTTLRAGDEVTVVGVERPSALGGVFGAMGG